MAVYIGGDRNRSRVWSINRVQPFSASPNSRSRSFVRLIVRLDVRSRSASPSRRSRLFVHSFLTFGRLIALGLLFGLLLDRLRSLRTNVLGQLLNCFWLIVRPVARSFSACTCESFLTIGSSNCERSKTKSTLLIDRALASNHPPWVHLRA